VGFFLKGPKSFITIKHLVNVVEITWNSMFSADSTDPQRPPGYLEALKYARSHGILSPHYMLSHIDKILILNSLKVIQMQLNIL
jgi:hypothetical protein